MKKLLIAFPLLCATVFAQAAPQPTNEQQQKVGEAFQAQQRALREVQAASARSESLPADSAAKSRVDAALEVADAERHLEVAAQGLLVRVYYVMAQMKVSPDEWSPQLGKDGRLSFVEVKK